MDKPRPKKPWRGIQENNLVYKHPVRQVEDQAQYARERMLWETHWSAIAPRK
jgi:hypothetical protein